MQLIIKLVFLTFCFFNVMLAYAEPAPFGIKIKETDIEEIKSKYKFKDHGINEYSRGAMLYLDPAQFEFEGLISILLIFAQDGKVLAVMMELNKARYNKLLDMLSSKYKLVKKKDAFVGNQSAEFRDDNTIISLDSPHLSFEMSMNYIHNDLNEIYTKSLKKKTQEKEKRELDNI